MSKLIIKQVRSSNGANQRQRDTLQTLGLGKVNRTTERPDSPQVRGMLHRVRHLIEVKD